MAGALGATSVIAFPLLAAVWLPGGKRHLEMLQPSHRSQTCLHLLCGQRGSCPSTGLSLSLHGLLPFPVPLVPSKAQLQMKPSFSPHVFSHCTDASFPAQSFGNSSCPLQLRPFFPLSLTQAARYAGKPWSLTKP